MPTFLKLDKVNKSYETFKLKDVSFEIKPGQIMGFIGRNGAGKTTTLKCIMNLIHYESGNITAFDTSMIDNELENKQRIGFSLSEINYYPNRKIKELVAVIKRFYRNFDELRFKEICKLFKLDENKKIDQLSSGMKVKYNLALALSHKADLLILDEPTSGLDPISRDEILDIFRDIVKKGDRAILFSTHITSDLDKCATDITYISNGAIAYTGSKSNFINSYLFVKDTNNNDSGLLAEYISYKNIGDGLEGLIPFDKKDLFESRGCEVRSPDLEEIMIFLERSNEHEGFDL